MLPNRDALQYEALYGLDPAETHTCFRGTLRYQASGSVCAMCMGVGLACPQTTARMLLPSRMLTHDFSSNMQGWSELMLGCRALGLLAHTPLPSSSSSSSSHSLLATALGLPSSSSSDDTAAAALARLRAEPGVTDPARVLAALRWLGLLGEGGSGRVMNEQGGEEEVIDAFCRVLEGKLGYGEGERDMVAMRHDVVVDFPASGVTERHTATLLTYGDGEGAAGGHTAMAKTVGWTSALAVGLLLDGGLDARAHAGVRTPLSKEVYEPLLARLAEAGVAFEESVERRPLVEQQEGKGEGRPREQKAA